MFLGVRCGQTINKYKYTRLVFGNCCCLLDNNINASSDKILLRA